jgi:hypothetical protein
MLDWKRVDGSWFGNGFRVQQVGPALWSLENAEVQGSIDVSDPIARLGTLEACKHKAETLHDELRLMALRKRLGVIGAGGWALALVVANPIAFIVCGVIGSAALLELLATWLDGRVGGIREFVQ